MVLGAYIISPVLFVPPPTVDITLTKGAQDCVFEHIINKNIKFCLFNIKMLKNSYKISVVDPIIVNLGINDIKSNDR